ncbi:MAG: PEGA domain-containing protein [Pseudomonadota bacterium]
MLREVKERHYADLADQPLPALGGKTPLEAVRTKAGRDQVDLLLKGFENYKARLPKSQQVDFLSLRKERGFKA